MSRVLAALLALIAILAGVLLYVASGARRAGGASTPTAEIGATPPPPAAELVPIPETEPASTPAKSVAASAEPAQREAALTTHAEELTRAQWLEGRVLFPDGTPLDEEVFVTADGRPFEDGSDHRVRVERDGAFRVAFSEKTRSGRLELAARYLYLPESVRWKRDATEPVVLEPALGGRIAVRVVAPHGTDPEQAGGKVLLHVEERDANSSWNEQRGAQPLSPELTAAFDALRPGNEYTPSYDGSTFFGTSRSVAVEAGETSSVEIVLRPGVVLAGRVRDEGGAPLADAEVDCTSQGGPGIPDTDRFRSVATSADGTFRLGALFPDELTLEVQLDGFETAVLRLGKLDEGTIRSDLELVLTHGGSISGVVAWPDGTPAEADLELSPHLDVTGWDGSQRDQSGKSDASGSFRITGLSAKSYRVRARATKIEEVTVTSELTGRERKKKQRTPWSAELDRVKPGSDDVELTLSTGLALSGRVFDELGVPLSDFRVSATRQLELGMFPSLDGQTNKSFRDAGGAFVLEGLAPGAWSVVASAAGHARSESVRVTITATTPVVLEPIELCVPREARLSGVVLDAHGAPCAGATVNAVQAGEDDFFFFLDDDPDVRTDEKSAFQLERLRPGMTVLTAAGAAGAPSEPLELELVAGQDTAGLVLRLRTGATLIGEVVGRDGHPEANVEVDLYGNDGGYDESLTADADGRFEARGLPPGEIYVHAENRDGLELVQSLTLREGETARVRLAPPAGMLVRLRGYLRAGGEPLGEANVLASRSGENDEEEGPHTRSSSAQSDDEGAYELTLPGAGRYELMVHSGNFAALSWRTTLEVPEVDELVFDFEIPLGRVSGRVTDGAGKALAGVWIESEPARHEGSAHGGARTRTDDEGRYELAIPAGTHVISAGGDMGWGPYQASQYVAARVNDLVVSENGHVRGVDFELSTGGTLEGSVRASDASAARYAQLWSSHAADTRKIGWSDEHGSFRIEGLAPGTHWIGATGDGRATRAAVQVEIEAGKTARVELELVPATLVHVRVRDAAGALVGCEIEVLGEDGRSSPNHGMSQDAFGRASGGPGEVLVGPLAAGRYTVRARREEKLAERALEIDATEPKLELELKFE